MATGSETTLSTDHHNGVPRPGTDGTVSEKPLNPDETPNMDPITNTSTEPEIHYPKGASLWTIFAGLFFAVLCVGLVCFHFVPFNPSSLTFIGPIHRRDSHPSNHKRLQLPRRCRLVRFSIPPHNLLFPAPLRKVIR